MRRFLWIVLFALSAATLPAAAGAQHLSIDDVRNMALARGVVTIKEIELDDGIWEAQGPRRGRPQDRDEGRRLERRDREDEAQRLSFGRGVKSAGRVYPHAIMPKS